VYPLPQKFVFSTATGDRAYCFRKKTTTNKTKTKKRERNINTRNRAMFNNFLFKTSNELILSNVLVEKKHITQFAVVH